MTPRKELTSSIPTHPYRSSDIAHHTLAIALKVYMEREHGHITLLTGV